MSKQLLLCLLGLLLFASCKKEIATTATTTTETVGAVTVQNLDFTYLTARGQMSVEDKGQSLSSGISLRMKKDSVLWVSVLPGLGIEAARIKITPDSIFVMNRLRKEYTATDYRFINSRFNIDLNFDILQAIMVGNYQANGSEKATIEGQRQHVQQLRGNLIFDYFINQQSLRLHQLNVKDEQTGNNITVMYDNFQNIGTVPFAYGLNAQVLQGGQTSTLNISHNRVTISDEALEFPFAVPADYKRF